jgi:RimJ/RimL family protein N-acetyltransferase
MSATPTFIKPKLVSGNNLTFRDATVDDAAFIVELRTDADKARFISATSPDVQKQIAWLANYAKDPSQIYFIIQDKAGAPVGTVRLYDQRNDSFCWGSWILKAGTPSSYSVESALIIYHYARELGFTRSHFDVRKENASVWKFHERFGAKRIEETDIDYFYNIDADAIAGSLQRYAKFLPDGISITP